MAKETFYFSHDYNARSDVKTKALLKKLGMVGYGIYWSIIEDLYNNANALPLHYDSIAYDLRTQSEKVKSVVNDFDLFVIDGDVFGSMSVQRRIDERNAKSKKASDSAYKRWAKDANALQPHSDGNAIKESKGKKVKESKETIEVRKQKFAYTLEPFLIEYGRDMLNAFYCYWTESGPNDRKFRQEKQTSWDIARRLQTWKSKEKNNGKANNTNIADRNKSLKDLKGKIADARNDNAGGLRPAGQEPVFIELGK